MTSLRDSASNVLDLSAFCLDSAAALLCDGTLVAAAQGERFSRKKHDARFSQKCIEYCLMEVGIGLTDVDLIAF